MVPCPVAFGHDGLGDELARLVLRPLRLCLVLGLVLLNRNVFVARENGTAFALLPLHRADLHELGFGGDGGGDVRLDLRLIAAWVGASVLLAKVGKQELVMPGTVGAVHAATGDGDEMRVALVERSVFEKQEHVRLNPETQVADRKKNTGGLLAVAGVDLLETSGEPLRLEVGG